MSRAPEHRFLKASFFVLGSLSVLALAGAPLSAALAGRESVLFAWTDGARATLAAASIVMVVSFVAGLAAGGSAALGPSFADALLALVMEVAGALPSFAVVLVVRALSPTSELMAVAVVLAVLRGLATAKVVRAELLQLENQEFVLSARALGSSRFRLFRRHLVPHVAGPVLADAAHAAAAVVALDTALALAGLGTGERTWGSLFAGAVERASPGVALVPALGVAATVAALLVVGQALENGWRAGRSFL
ncbi:MAG TPA: ABC transporter permease subunit [Polyangiaceae bacterium]|jgi:peptide/nickel transport system permease protein|nr:ABC transporter permease subunit [Polyangiaceae bacterium]